MKRSLAITIIFNLCCVVVSAQQLGLRPPGTDLLFIDTDTVRVIFEEGQEKDARRVADIAHYMAREYPVAGTDKLRKISILLQNRTDIPNGYVGLAPWRSEFYLSAPPGNFSLGSMPWVDQLAIHEFRHVQQRSASRTGLSEFAYYLFGEDFFGAVVNISWPNWYTEGDAVVFETALSGQGRGRLPAFMNGYREQVRDGDYWSYMKARNGSFKDFVPSHYHLGFLMQNYGRARYGQTFWDTVALEAASYKGLIYPFSKAVKRVSGLSTREFYSAAMDHYRGLWNKEAEDKASGNRGRFIDYNYPCIDKDGDVFVLIDSYDRIPGIFKRVNGDFEHVVDVGIMADDMFSVGGGKICWAEYRWDSRWERVDYSSIVVCDKDGRNKKRLTKKLSYFSPALSADGETIAAFHDDDFHNYTLHLLNSSTGEVFDIIKIEGNLYLTNLTWTEDGYGVLSAARDSVGRMAIVHLDLSEGAITPLTKWSYRTLGRPIESDSVIYFTRSDALYDRVCRLIDGKIEMLDHNGRSVYDPIVDVSGDVLYSEFTLDGNKLNSSPVDEFIRLRNNPWNYLALDEGEYNILGEVPQGSYDESTYGLFKQPVNIHSWRPVFDDPIYAFEMQSENVLQSIRWNTGFQWNSNNNNIGPYSELTLGMWYPEVLVGYSGWTRSAVRQSDNQEFNWYENNLRAGLRIPFKALYGPFVMNGSVTSRINRLFTSGDIEYDLNYLSHRIVFQHRQRRAQKHPITRFGQAVDISVPHSIDADTAVQFQIKTDFTFPSPIRNHVVWLQFDYRKELTSNTYVFGDDFNYARGYEANRFDQNFRIGVNYQLPLVYPDWGFAGIIYFKRIRANLFGDFSTGKDQGVTQNYNSVGAELIFDVELLNVEPFTFGVRWSHLLQDDPNNAGVRNVWGVFVPVNRI